LGAIEVPRGWGGGVPCPLGEEAQPSPEKFFLILNLKMAICGAISALQLKL